MVEGWVDYLYLSMKKLFIILFISLLFPLIYEDFHSVNVNEDSSLTIKYYQKNIVNKKISLIRLESYYPNGQINSEENYIDGKKDGKWTWYYENGQIQIEGNYIDGKRDGKWTWYYENGQIQIEVNYIDGEPIETIEY